MESLNIVHVVHYFLPRHRHGTELAVHELAKAQQAAGHRVTIVAGELGHPTSEVKVVEETFDGLPVRRIYFNPRRSNGYLEHPGLTSAFKTLLLDLRPDIVHFQHLSTLSLALVAAAQDTGAPAIMTLHDYALICARTHLLRGDGSRCPGSDLETDCLACLRMQRTVPGRDKAAAIAQVIRAHAFSLESWKKAATRTLHNLAGIKPLLALDSAGDFEVRNRAVWNLFARLNLLISPSADLARRFETFARLEEGTVHVLPQTVELGRCIFRPRKVSGAPLKLGFVGKISHHKGLHVLLEAMRRLEPGSVSLQVYGTPNWAEVGEAAYFQRMKRLAAGLDVTFHAKGFPPGEAHRAYDSFDVLVVPSVWYETFGRIVLEAFASGVPVLCSDEGGPAELVRNGVDGLHFRIGDAGSLAEILKRLVERPGEVERLSGNVNPPKSTDTYAGEVVAMYRDVIARAQPVEEP